MLPCRKLGKTMTEHDEPCSSGQTFKDPCIFCHSRKQDKVANWNIRCGYSIYYETIDTPKFGGCNGLISMGDTPCYWLIGIVSYQPELFFAAGYSTLVPKKNHKFSHRCYVVWPAMVIECHRTTWSVSAACCEGSWINAPKSGQLQRCCWWFFGFPRVTNCSANDIQSHPCML